MADKQDSPPLVLPKTRGYQQEMLEESLRGNIIIALDTGSGKTHIAVLRMKIEAEREPIKVALTAVSGPECQQTCYAF
jgi:ERCC4-related helicase